MTTNIDENGKEYPGLCVTDEDNPIPGTFQVEIVDKNNKSFGKKYTCKFTGQGYFVLHIDAPYDLLSDMFRGIEDGSVYKRTSH